MPETSFVQNTVGPFENSFSFIEGKENDIEKMPFPKTKTEDLSSGSYNLKSEEKEQGSGSVQRSEDKKEIIKIRRFVYARQYEGEVKDIFKDFFTARLINPYDKTDELEGRFSLKNVERKDIPLLREGAAFSWVIGMVKEKSGTENRKSEISFRKVPAWSEETVKEAERKAEEILNALQQK